MSFNRKALLSAGLMLVAAMAANTEVKAEGEPSQDAGTFVSDSTKKPVSAWDWLWWLKGSQEKDVNDRGDSRPSGGT